MYKKDKEAIKKSNLKVKDFGEIYEGEILKGVDLNDTVEKRIMNYF